MSATVWTEDFQTGLDYTNWDLSKLQIPILPDRLDWGFPNRFGLPKLRFEQVSNHNFLRPFGLRISKPVWITHIEIWASFKSQFSPTIWTEDFQKGSDYPNWDLSKFQIPIFPDRLDWGFPNRFGLPKLRFEQVSNPNFPRPFGLRISKSVQITQIEIWAGLKSQFSPNRLDSKFPNRWITQIDIWTSFKYQLFLTI